MSHRPVGYNLNFATSAEISAYQAKVDAGDVAYAADVDAQFIYNATSTEALQAGIVLNGPGGVGRWLIASRHIYGGLYLTNGATPQAFSATPAKMIGWSGTSASYGVTSDTAGSRLVVPKAGDYQIGLSLSGNSSAVVAWDFHVTVDGVVQPGSGVRRTGAVGSPFGGTTLIVATLAAGGVIEVYGTAGTGTPTMTFLEASLTAVRLT